MQSYYSLTEDANCQAEFLQLSFFDRWPLFVVGPCISSKFGMKNLILSKKWKGEWKTKDMHERQNATANPTVNVWLRESSNRLSSFKWKGQAQWQSKNNDSNQINVAYNAYYITFWGDNLLCISFHAADDDSAIPSNW